MSNWLHINPSSGNRNTVMTISADTNNTGAPRKAKIIITAGTMTREISVIQNRSDSEIFCTYVVGQNSTLQLINYSIDLYFHKIPGYAFVYNNNGDFLRVDYNQLVNNENVDLSSLGVVEGDVVTVLFYDAHDSELIAIDYFNNVRLKTISFKESPYYEICGLLAHLPYLEVVDLPATYLATEYPIYCIDCPRLSAFTGDSPLIQDSRTLLWRYTTINNETIDMLAGVALYGIEEYVVPSNITEIYKSCFAYTPNNVQTIKSIVFNQPEIKFNLYGRGGQDDTYIGMFENIASLTSVTLPNVVNTGNFTEWYFPCGYKMFYGCTGLTSVNIPTSGFTNGIQYGMFYNCSSLKQLTIPSGITAIESAFSGCTSLTSITAERATAATVSSTTFQGIATGGTLYHPEGSNYNVWLSGSTYYLGYYLWNDGIPFNLENISTYYLQYLGNASGSGVSQSVFITANKPDYQVIASDVQNTTGNGVTWITVSGTPNTGRVEYKVYPSTTAATQRNCWLQVVYNDEIYASVTVVQLAASETAVTPTITVAPSQLGFVYNASGSSSGQNVTVNSNVVYSYSATTNWISVSGTPNSGTTTLKVYPNSNNTGSSSRSGNLLIRYNDTTYQTISIIQSAQTVVPVSYDFEFVLNNYNNEARLLVRKDGSSTPTFDAYVNDTYYSTITITGTGWNEIYLTGNSSIENNRFAGVLNGSFSSVYEVGISTGGDYVEEVYTYNKITAFHLVDEGGLFRHINKLYLDSGYFTTNTRFLPNISYISGSSMYITSDHRKCIGRVNDTYGCWLPSDKDNPTPSQPNSWRGDYTYMCYATSGLSSVNVPENYLCSFDDNYLVTKYNGIREITLPYSPMSTNIIFAGWKDLTSVTLNCAFIQDTVNMFYSCTGMTSVSLPYIKTLQDHTFSYSNITSITFQDDVEYVHESAFYDIPQSGVIHYSSRLRSSVLNSMTGYSQLSGWTFVQDVT